MRTLVNQTCAECQKWFANLGMSDEVSVHTLMGGEDGGNWDQAVEKDMVLIGTQDMLLSRALNRGYGMSRYRWPMHFALLNNDCLWVFDETQLMGVGLTTSVQLSAFRRQLDTYLPTQTLWMSATLDTTVLQTVDSAAPDFDSSGISLGDEDLKHATVQKLLGAAKPVKQVVAVLSRETQKSYEKDLAAKIVDAHKPHTLTLAVINNVQRAQLLFQAIRKLSRAAEEPDVMLVHSRFRPGDRNQTQEQALNERTIPPAGRILIATQAIEAGVDVSATTMFTELAPWSSLVQRFGRCNRRGDCGIGDHPEAAVHWIDIDTSDGKVSKFTLPYSPADLDAARSAIAAIPDAGLKHLSDIQVETAPAIVDVLRKKDLIDLFDTTPDLAGKDLDVSRYIRETDDTDVQIYWRDWDVKQHNGRPPRTEDAAESPFPGPHRDELCSVSYHKTVDFIRKLKPPQSAWTWDALERLWRKLRPNEIRPGMLILFHTSVGGYDAELGWTGNTKQKPAQLNRQNQDESYLTAMEDDDHRGVGKPLSITQHLADVVYQAEQIRNALAETELPWKAIITAARWHDVGKAHPAFQTAMRDSQVVAAQDDSTTTLWAKSGGTGIPRYRIEQTPEATLPERETDQLDGSQAAGNDREVRIRKERRTGFRHELASALAWLHHCTVGDQVNVDGPLIDLVAYLIASHHGKVRLSIRSMPSEDRPPDGSRKFARGIWEGDIIPAVTLDDGTCTTTLEPVCLDLMGLGETKSGTAWLTRTLALRDSGEFGPFRLAYLETLVRLADWRGSANPRKGAES